MGQKSKREYIRDSETEPLVSPDGRPIIVPRYDPSRVGGATVVAVPPSTAPQAVIARTRGHDSSSETSSLEENGTAPSAKDKLTKGPVLASRKDASSSSSTSNSSSSSSTSEKPSESSSSDNSSSPTSEERNSSSITSSSSASEEQPLVSEGKRDALTTKVANGTATENPAENRATRVPKEEQSNGMKREREEGIEDKRKIYIGGMPFHYDEAGIREFWEYCGEVSEVDLMTFPDTGRFRGIAIVTFATEAGAEEALQHDGGDCEGKRLVVKRYQKSGRGATPAKRARGGPQKTEGYLVAYVGNLPFDSTEDSIKGIFEGCNVTRVRMHTDKVTGDFKGFAHVHFKTGDDLDRAVGLDGQIRMGREMRVAYAKPKQ